VPPSPLLSTRGLMVGERPPTQIPILPEGIQEYCRPYFPKEKTCPQIYVSKAGGLDAVNSAPQALKLMHETPPPHVEQPPRRSSVQTPNQFLVTSR
jgi:hypothetical protein